MIDTKALREKVLDLAMRGKLVEQDDNDEPVNELLEKINKIKEHMIISKKIKKGEPLKLIDPQEHPFEVPSSWNWIRLGNITNLLNGKAYKKEELLNDDNLTPVLRVGNFFTNKNWYYSDIKLEENKYADFGDLLYAWSASFGPKIWEGSKVI